MQQNLLMETIFFCAMLSIMAVTCTPNIDTYITDKDKMNKEKNVPAYHIVKSEKLDIPAAIELPANLPGGNTRVATFFAEGVQKYRAQQKAGSNPVVYEWMFVAPQADLYDMTNKKIGTHSAGPSWQLFGSADSIFAQQFSPPKTAASSDPSSIDWLQLMPKTGKTPSGFFANVSYIQRIATKGGKAPARSPVSESEMIEVKYTAVYRFSKMKS